MDSFNQCLKSQFFFVKWVGALLFPKNGLAITFTWQNEPWYSALCSVPTVIFLSLHCSLPTANCSMFTAHCSLLAAQFSMLTVHYLLLTAHSSLLTAHCKLNIGLASACWGLSWRGRHVRGCAHSGGQVHPPCPAVVSAFSSFFQSFHIIVLST